MNKKVLIGILVAIVVVIASIGTYIAMKPNSSSDNTPLQNTEKSSVKLSAVKACDLFIETEAKQLLGESAKSADNTAPASSDDVSVDTCSYTNNSSSVPEIRVATVMVRSALTDDGLNSNKEAFEAGGSANPANAIAVEGYGEKAFWDPATYQLAILKDNMWIGVVFGGTNPTNNTLDDAKRAANLVLN